MNKQLVYKDGESMKWGLIAGLILIAITTLNYTVLLSNYIVFLVTTFVIYIIYLVLYWISGVQQRKALGGYIEFKQAFRAIFITILISSVMLAAWEIIYSKVIDPQLAQKIQNATIEFMQRMKVPEEKIDETITNFEKQDKNIQWGTLVSAFAIGIVVKSLFGMMVAYLIRRKPETTMQ